MPHLPDFEAWAIFAKVAALGSFSAAAQELNLSKATVSKAVTRLEQRLGTSLFHRTSRKLALTESGLASLERAARILAEGEAAEEEASGLASKPRGRIRLSAPMSFGIQHLGPALPEFMALYPDIAVELVLGDARTDLVEQGIDVALRIGTLADSSLRARRLFAVRRPLVAAPAYLAQHGAPHHAKEIEDHDVLVFSHLANPSGMQLNHAKHGALNVRLSGRVTTNNADIALPLLRAGTCMGFMPEFLVWRDLRDGLLVEVLPDWSSELLALHVVTPPGALRPARVTALIDFLVRTFKTVPWAYEEGAPLPN
jgi:DNA-binding transcriptional LysR family regulator